MIQEASLYPDEDEDGFLQRKKNWIFFPHYEREPHHDLMVL